MATYEVYAGEKDVAVTMLEVLKKQIGNDINVTLFYGPEENSIIISGMRCGETDADYWRTFCRGAEATLEHQRAVSAKQSSRGIAKPVSTPAL